jgi:glycosyltransferase involved in cell wall biosynthesis
VTEPALLGAPKDRSATKPGRASVLIVHERYQQLGGEDVAVQADRDLLDARGHRIVYYERHNDEILDLNAAGRARVALGTIWSGASRRALADVIDEHRPDLVHVHNTFPLISPSIYGVAAKRGIPVVQTLHNYRLVCATGAMQRDGHPCHECEGRRIPIPAIQHACYRGSRLQSAVAASMQATHLALRTWDRSIDLYLPVSEHVRRRLVDAGAIPTDRTMVRHNHVAPDPGLRPAGSDQGYAVFVGRLAPEKGVDILVRAATLVPELAVRVIGDGPERPRIERLAREVGSSNLTFIGRLSRREVLEQVRRARCLVLPSTWEEPQGVVLIEAAALGVPAIATDLGGTGEAVSPDSGLLIPPGDVARLAEALKDAATHPERWWRKGEAARKLFEAGFSADRAYETLLAAYDRVLTPPNR